MRTFNKHAGVVVPIDQSNVDTDMILPKQFLKSVTRDGYGPYLFDGLRYLDEGVPGEDCADRAVNLEFALNFPRYIGASILLSRKNFGCGSSREHAVWALDGYGIRAIIAESFADIFYNNCINNGILPVVLDEGTIGLLFEDLFAREELQLTIDLDTQIVAHPDGESIYFEIDEFRKHCLQKGVDGIGVTLQNSADIRYFESQHAKRFPWVFGAIR